MPAKPPLAIVDSGSSTPPPRKLGQHGMELWRTIMAEYQLEDRGGIELLCQACGALDRVEELSERIASDGAVITVRGVPKPHPALAAELAARALVCRTLERLGLNLEAVKPIGRPSKAHAD
jgi:hypothetical protein